MRPILFLLLFLLHYFTSHPQNITDSIPPLFQGKIDGDAIREKYAFYHSSFPGVNSKETSPKYELVMGIFSSNQLAITKQLPHEKIGEIKGFFTDSDSIRMKGTGYYASNPVPVFDTAGIIVTVNGINSKNAGEYQFRVIENKTKEIIPWRNFHLFCEAYLLSYDEDGSEAEEVAYLGQFKTRLGNSLSFEIRKKENKVASISAIWINRSPSVLGTFTTRNMQEFLQVFKSQWQHDIMLEYNTEERMQKDTLLVFQRNFGPGDNNIIFYLDDKVRSKDIIEYNLISGKGSSGWQENDFDLNLIWLKDLNPGKYTLQMRYSIQQQNVSQYSFSIEPAWYQTLLFKILIVPVILAVPGIFLLLIKLRKQKQELLLEQLLKRIKQTELRTIRAQLNPHFIFNSLNSIQGLITTNQSDKANQYLTRFSTLLRESLTENDNELISLSSEIKILDSYLQLEQLRFGFSYSINIEPTINPHDIEVPAILLQPPVENAVKHGVAALYEKGKITINFKKSDDDLVVYITDHGPGFLVSDLSKGFGLKLTKERIALLNSLTKESSIAFNITSGPHGTTVYLHFKNWMS